MGEGGQAGRPLPPKTLSILVGLTLNLDTLCTIVNIVENFWTFGWRLKYFELQAWKELFCKGLAEMRFHRK